MRAVLRKAAPIGAAATVALVLLVATGGEAKAQWGFYYNPQNNSAGWNLGGYSTHYKWGPSWFYSNGAAPGGIKGSYYRGPGYNGWSHWGPNHNHGAGKLQVPWLNNGNPVQWSY